MPHGSEKCLCVTGSVTVCGSWLYSRMQRGFGLGKEGSPPTWSLTSLKSTIPTMRLLSLKGLCLILSMKCDLPGEISQQSQWKHISCWRKTCGSSTTRWHGHFEDTDTGKWQPLLCEAQCCDTSSAWWVRHFAAHPIDKAIATCKPKRHKQKQINIRTESEVPERSGWFCADWLDILKITQRKIHNDCLWPLYKLRDAVISAVWYVSKHYSPRDCELPIQQSHCVNKSCYFCAVWNHSQEKKNGQKR